MRKKALWMLGMMILCVGCGAAGTDAANETQQVQEAEADSGSEAAETAQTPETEEEAESDETESEEGKEGMRANLTPEQIESEKGEDIGTAIDGANADRDLFADFLKGIGEAEVSDKILWRMDMTESEKLESGKVLSAADLADFLQNKTFASGAEYSISYAPLTVSAGQAFAMSYLFNSEPEPYTVLLVFSEKDGKLSITFAADQWSRRSVDINAYGIIQDSGSGGAGSHFYSTYAPDQNGVYQIVTETEEEYYGFSFYGDDGQPLQDLNDIMQKAGEGNKAAQDVVYYLEKINGKDYYYFLGAGKLTQDTVDYIDLIASTYNFKFDGKEAADPAREAYEKELGISETVGSEEKADWTEYK